jgi:phosphomannomutase
MLFAEDVLKRHAGAIVVADIKASGALFVQVRRLGGTPLMWKAGHSHIKSKMKETGALLGGEVTGHVFLADDYYGFDDALYAAVRLIAATVRLGQTVTELHDAMPVMVNTPELRFAVDEARKFAVIDEVRARLVADRADIVSIDGVRVTTPEGWWLLRASNTEAMLTARAESTSQQGLAHLLTALDAQLAASGIRR